MFNTRSICAVLATAFCFSGTGNDSVFDAVAGQLDPGGEYYEISAASHVRKEIKDFFYAVVRSLVECRDESIDDNGRKKAIGMLLIAENAVKRSGIGDIAATGKSSVALGNGLFREKTVIQIRENANGVLWKIPSPENSPITDSLSHLPNDTVFAGVFDCDFTAFVQEPWFSGIFPDPEERQEILSGISGRWILFATEDGRTFFHIPDRGNKFYSWVKPHLCRNGFVENDEKMIVSPAGIPLLFYKAKDMLNGALFFEDGDIADDPTLGGTPWFRALASGLPKNGVGCFFLRGRKLQDKVSLFGLPVEFSHMSPDKLCVIERTESGFRITGNSSHTPQGEKHLRGLYFLGKALAFYDDEIAALLSGNAGEEDLAPAHLAECQQKMEDIYRALGDYRKKHGFFPKGRNLDGWEELVAENPLPPHALCCPACGDDDDDEKGEKDGSERCCYIYLGDWGELDGEKMPLVLDLPKNHPDAFNVLYSDGTIATLGQENLTALRKEISVLHTLHRYDEKRFAELMRRASELDKLLNME